MKDTLRHTTRNLLLTLNYIHPAALFVAARRGPKAAQQYLSEISRCSKTDAGQYLSTVMLADLVSEAATFSVYRPLDGAGSLTTTEISLLCCLVAARQPLKVLEIGSFRGLTTHNIALNAKDAEIHTLDLPPDVEPTSTEFHTGDLSIIQSRGFYHYRDRPEELQIQQHYGDTATFDYSEIGSGVDFCLIDAAHSYEYVRNDTAKSLNLMTDDGLILWHDYGRNDFLAKPEDAWGVTRFLNEIADVGVGILQGTSLGVLALTRDRRRRLAQHLELTL